MKKLSLVLTLIIVIIGFALRVSVFTEIGDDFEAYTDALTSVTNRINPYEETLRSYSNSEDITIHKFSYLPGLLFLYLPLFLISIALREPDIFPIICKIPVILADLGICILLYKEISKHDKWAAFFVVLLWVFNPYFTLKRNYVYMDPIPMLFMLLGLYHLKKRDLQSAIFYAISCIFKTFPIILLPIFIIRAKNKMKFLAWFSIPFLAVSAPFIYDPITYIRGALLVHSGRPVQGKPFLHTISYKMGIELIRVVPLKIYSFISVFGGWILVIINESFGKILKTKSNYTLSLLPFSVFYAFTHVLNKTYLLWVAPLVILGSFDLVKERKWPKWKFYALTSTFYLFYFYYLLIWGRGLHVDYKYY